MQGTLCLQAIAGATASIQQHLQADAALSEAFREERAWLAAKERSLWQRQEDLHVRHVHTFPHRLHPRLMLYSCMFICYSETS